jgi:branched-chain amino acid transport system substrate-binding protein
MTRSRRWKLLFAACLSALGVNGASAQDTIKIGFIAPLTGQFQSIGQQMIAGAKLYVQEHGTIVAGKKIELIIRDDGGAPDVTRRIAQQYIVNDHVAVLGGFTFTPTALAVAPLATESKTPQVVMTAGTSIITERSPYIVRTGFTVAQSMVPLAEWASKEIKRVVTIVSDYAPGVDAETSFGNRYVALGGTVLERIRVPVQNPDFAPFLQRAHDLNPDAIFLFAPPPSGATFMRQFVERGMDKAGIQVIGSGDIMGDDLLPQMGDAALGVVTAHFYSADHASAVNVAFVEAFKKANGGIRPSFIAVTTYDGLHLIYEAIRKTGGVATGEVLLEAMKGMTWESPRGPIMIDPETRDVVNNVYIRRVEKKNGELYNVEFATFDMVKDPVKAGVAR